MPDQNRFHFVLAGIGLATFTAVCINGACQHQRGMVSTPSKPPVASKSRGLNYFGTYCVTVDGARYETSGPPLLYEDDWGRRCFRGVSGEDHVEMLDVCARSSFSIRMSACD